MEDAGFFEREERNRGRRVKDYRLFGGLEDQGRCNRYVRAAAEASITGLLAGCAGQFTSLG